MGMTRSGGAKEHVLERQSLQLVLIPWGDARESPCFRKSLVELPALAHIQVISQVIRKSGRKAG